MKKIGKNSLVTLSLKMEGEDGTFLDESDELVYLHGGYGQIFQKLEETLEGKTVGYCFDILLQPKEAFGEYEQSLVVKESLDELPEELELGMELEGEDENTMWIVESIEDGYATLNANHELAGLTLRVFGTVLDFEQLTEENAQKILDMDHEH